MEFRCVRNLASEREKCEAKANIVVLSIKLILNLGLWIYILHFPLAAAECSLLFSSARGSVRNLFPSSP